MHRLFLFFILCFCSLEATQATYPYNPYVEVEFWDAVAPYFLPEDHPVKAALDKIFLQTKKRVTQRNKSLKRAKFKAIQKAKMKHPSVVSHPSIEGYLLKIYVDKQLKINDGQKFLDRTMGALVVRDVLDKYDFHSYFKVPKKWIYPLPQDPSPPNKSKYKRKNFILVVEEMNILDKKQNIKKWTSSLVSPPFLDALYILLDEAGLSDSTFSFNIPFSHDGRIAFIDTEYYHNWPVYLKRLGKFMTREMKEYWDELITLDHQH